MENARAQWLEKLGGLRVEAETLFPETTGFFVKRRNKRRADVLGQIKSVVERALQPEETVRYAARGMRYIWWEYYLTGVAVAQYSNMQALVLTDRRLLLIHVSSRGKPGDIKNAVALGDVRTVTKKFGSRLVLELADGKQLAFTGLGKDAKVLAGLIPATPGPKAAERSLQHLCPECLKPAKLVPDDDAVCPNDACQIPFRSAKRAARMSLLMPGLGDLYLRHNLFGTLELVGSTVALMLALFFFLIAAAAGFKGSDAIPMLVIGLLLFLAPRAVDYGLTLHMGRKGIVPLASRPVGSTGIALLPFFPRWAYALFVVIGLGVAGGVSSMVPEARQQAKMNLAVDAATRGDFALATQHYEAAAAVGQPSDTSIGALAAAYFEAGNIEDGNKLVVLLGGRTIEGADRINAAIARIDADHEAYEAARTQLLGGDVDGGLAALALAVDRVGWIQKPAYPKTRDEAVVSVVRDLFVGAAPPSLEIAGKLLPHVEARELAAQAATGRAYLAALGDDVQTAKAELATVDAARLDADWAYFHLETRAMLASAEDYPALLAEAEKATVGLDLEQRRSELVDALRGSPAGEVAADVP